MKTFGIYDLERLSGIKSHTIRVWEQRYQLFTPQRTEGNTRIYNIDDVQRLLNITLLVKNGIRISKLAELSCSETEQQLRMLTSEDDRILIALHHLIIYKYRAEIEKFEDVLDSCVLTLGIDTTINKVIVPFLEKADLLSYCDRKYETHFAVTAIRRKIILGIERIQATAYRQCTALLFLAEGEHYDLILLYMEYLLKRSGVRVLYLGTNVPLEDQKQTIIAKRPHILFTYVPQKHKFKLHGLLPFLGEGPYRIPLFVATSEIIQLQQRYANVQFISYKEVLCVLGSHERMLPEQQQLFHKK